MWMLHLIGGGVWFGGLAGLLLLALPGAVPATIAAPSGPRRSAGSPPPP